MSRSMILISGTGDFKGDAGVKTAKLGVKQDQIGNPSEFIQKFFKIDFINFRK